MKKLKIDRHPGNVSFELQPGEAVNVGACDGADKRLSLAHAEKALIRWQKEQRAHIGDMAEQILLAEATFLRHNMPDKAAFARHYSGLLINERGQIQKAIAQFERNLEYFEQQGNETWQFRSLNSLGSAYVVIGQHSKSCEVLLKALDIAQRQEDMFHIGIALHNLARVYHHCFWFDLAEKYYRKAYRFRSRAGDLQGAVITRCSLAQVFSEQGDHERALEYLERAISVDKMILGSLLVIKIQGTIASIYAKQGRMVDALKLLEQVRSAAVKFDVPYLEVNACVEIGMIYQKQSDHHRALRIWSDILPKLRKLDVGFLLYRVYDGIYQAYRSLGMAQEALTAFEHYTKAKERHNGTSQSEILSALHARIELAQLHKTLDQRQVHNARLQSEVERQSKTLSIQALYLTQTRAALERARRSLADAQTEFGPDQRAVDALQAIENAHDLDAQLSAFEREFFHVRHSFIQTLQRHYPQLRPAELKVCALLTLGLATKEIAALLCLSERTVEQHRYRSRKKIGLGKNENLKTFLNTL